MDEKQQLELVAELAVLKVYEILERECPRTHHAILQRAITEVFDDIAEERRQLKMRINSQYGKGMQQ